MNKNPMTVLVTGAAGYIGSHTCLELLNNGMNIVAIDNLCNSKIESLRRVQTLAMRDLIFYEVDIRDSLALDDIFNKHKIDCVIHFAALKSVSESTIHPLRYYDNNINGTISLLSAMKTHGVKQIVFSSSATVYGTPPSVPIPENCPIGEITNPYGRSKRIMEEILQDVSRSEHGWQIALLRYFNPVGAHPSGQIGEDPQGIPNNLMPYIAQVAIGQRQNLNVFGGNYPTHDGTGVRDYIHVVDLAEAHVKTVEKLGLIEGTLTLNIGTGLGYSVLDIVKSFSKASQREIPFSIVARRPGDVACCYADPSKAEQILGWKASRTLDDMCADSWRWQQLNPSGYSR